MGGHVDAIWGWDDQVQRDFHARAFHPDRWQIITVGGADAGMLDVEYRQAEIYLGRIEIHPDYQGGGIGTRLVTALINEAGRKARISSWTCSPSTDEPGPSTSDSAWPKWPGTARTTRSPCGPSAPPARRQASDQLRLP
jgi:GNAT superfamily N-acetyltransferase